MILAVGINGELGKDNKLLWDNREDLKHFKKVTNNSIVVMGRKTFESIGLEKGLPNRTNYVLTRSIEKLHRSIKIIRNIEEILELAKDKEVWVIGGSSVYSLFIPYVKEVFITVIPRGFPSADTYVNINFLRQNKFRLASDPITLDDGVIYHYKDPTDEKKRNN